MTTFHEMYFLFISKIYYIKLLMILYHLLFQEVKQYTMHLLWEMFQFKWLIFLKCHSLSVKDLQNYLTF